MNQPPPNPRVIVVGNTGSGKSTLAHQISQAWGVPHTELDAVHWLPGWQERPPAEFRQLVQEVISQPTWVLDGNYSEVRDLIWARANTLIWLDYSLVVIFPRLARRTLGRAVRRDLLWGTNRESYINFLPHRDSLFVWAIRKQWSRRRLYEKLLAQPACSHLHVIRFHHPRDTQRWLAGNGTGRGA